MVCTIAMLSGPAAESFLDAQDLEYWCVRDDLNAIA